jgi:SAM-dependent methyltransferase
MPTQICKTMDRDDLSLPPCEAVLVELFALMRSMQQRGAEYSSWYGRANAWPSAWEHINRGTDYEPWPGNPDELRIPWFLLWEISWIVANTPTRHGARILDMGGAGSLFSAYLASRGCEVHTIDLQEDLCEAANRSASLMGWRLKAQAMDMTALHYPDRYFDHVFSICVFEHLPISGRIKCNAEVGRVLKPGGTAGFTFDYANPQSFGRIDTPADVREQFVIPSGLKAQGDGEFHDNGKRYLESPPCFGFGRFTKGMAGIHAILKGTMQRRRVLTGNTSYTMGAIFLRNGV